MQKSFSEPNYVVLLQKSLNCGSKGMIKKMKNNFDVLYSKSL